MSKQNEKSFKIVGLAAIFALAGLIVYIVTSVTGYLAASSVDVVPIVTSAAAIIIMLAICFAGQKISGSVVDLMMLFSVALLLYSFYEFVIGRVSLAADVYFIPVNYPASEATALHISLVGIFLYVIADIAVIAAAFMRRADER
ncbi:MAG: sodium:proton antiporter [[Ruminococcus] gnavus]|nr:sodium:proton antiporter [Mediterraneibacter gnavus]